jgi:hypothetical protein
MIHNLLNLLLAINDARKSTHFIVWEISKQLVKKNYKRRTDDLGLKASRDILRKSNSPVSTNRLPQHTLIYSAGPTTSMTQCNPVCSPAVAK